MTERRPIVMFTPPTAPAPGLPRPDPVAPAPCLPGDLVLFPTEAGAWVAALVASVDAYGNPMGVVDRAGRQLALCMTMDEPIQLSVRQAVLIGDDWRAVLWREFAGVQPLLAALAPFRAPPLEGRGR